MNNIPTLILNSGGLCGLVAAATLADQPDNALLFVDDGRPAIRQAHSLHLQQTAHYHYARRFELAIPHLFLSKGTAAANPQRYPLSSIVMLTAAASVAARHRLSRILWPVALGQDFQSNALATESLQLLEQQLSCLHDQPIQFYTPFMEMTLSQVVDLGRQMNCPFHLSRTCLCDPPQPCGQCDRCWRRAEAFRHAGCDDAPAPIPAAQPTA